jgi:predicted secreted protein
MYNDFYGLTDDPFRLTPDPGYFYCSETHEDAIKIIEYGIYNRKGFTIMKTKIIDNTAIIQETFYKEVDLINLLLEISESVYKDDGTLSEWRSYEYSTL